MLLNQKVREANPDKKGDFTPDGVYESLVGKKILKLEPAGYKLNLVQPLTAVEHDNLIDRCTQ